MGGFAWNLFGGWSARDRTSRFAGFVSVGAIATSLACVLAAKFLAGDRLEHDVLSGTYFEVAGFEAYRFGFGYLIDDVTLTMALLVAQVAACVHVFALSYMDDELVEEYVDHEAEHTPDGALRRFGRYDRFFAFLSLFCFAMFGLLLSGSLLQTFVFWELVGATSYFLIGFYNERPEARSAATNAFVVNRVGDAGFLIGLAAFGAAGVDLMSATPEPAVTAFASISADPHDHAEQRHEWQAYKPPTLLTIAALGVFAGCVGKSAQFPLQAWLPRAMAGPTPVSALVHSATMVAAGVYLMARLASLGLLTPMAEAVVTAGAAATIVIGAVCACVQTDLKAVLAYSTISQLGYMLLAIGCGDPDAGMFHLVTHAFFKSLLFLGAGAVIHACHHEQEMTRLGGLRLKMPLTAGAMLVGTLAISGLALPTFGLTASGWLGLSGFYSKDTILEAAHQAAEVREASWIFWVPLVSAGVTAFYMVRMWCGTFLGRTRSDDAGHAHEADWLMLVPLGVLATFAVFAGWFGPDHHGAAEHAVGETLDVPTLGVIAAFAGAGIATALYGFGGWGTDKVFDALGPFRSSLTWGLGFDCLYRKAFVLPGRAVGWVLGLFDRSVIDGLLHRVAELGLAVAMLDRAIDEKLIDGAVDGVAASARSLGRAAAVPQTGRLRQYVVFLAVGVTGAALLVTFWLP
ncbi:MAG: NADH-quinone oxidoreductase subunit L [Planctomycetota bacterium]